MIQATATAAFVLATLSLAPACAAPLKADRPGGAPKASQATGVTDDRRSISERFPDLDAYLAYLEKRSHLDGSWYREVRPGVYELQTGNLRLPDGREGKRIFTREELARKFGFSK